MIAFCVFFAGAVVMSLEILGSRILTPNFGSTVFVWGSLISVFLGGLTTGYWMGGNLADRRVDLRIFGGFFLISGLLIGALPLYADGVCNRIFDLNWDSGYSTLLASLILFFLPTLFLGAISPYAVKLRITALNLLGAGVGNLYAISSLGSILGTLFTTFYLIPNFGVRRIIVIEGLLLLVMGAWLASRWKKAPAASILSSEPLPESSQG